MLPTAWLPLMALDQQGHFRAGLQARQQGDFDAARQHLEAATKGEADSDMLNALGALYLSIDEPARAITAFQRASDINTAATDARCNWAATLLDQDGPSAALPLFQQLTQDHPDFLHGWFGLQECLLLLDQLDAAETAIQDCLTLHPDAQMARAHAAFLALKRGDEQLYRRDYDLSTWPRQLSIDLPGDYPTPRAFHADIRRGVMTAPTLQWDVLKQGLPPRGFARDLEKSRHPALVAWQQGLEATIAAFIKELEPVPGHPFLGSIPENWSVNWWCTILKGGGYHRMHNHEGAWLSGVYYLETGDAAARNDNAGWLEFSGAQNYVPGVTDSHWHQPAEGRFLVFPSYLLHGTSPFDGDDLRLSLSFDLIPEG